MNDSAPPMLRVDVLGPLRLVVDGHPVDVPGERRRALLALLALTGGRAVGIDRLIDALWPDDPPEGAVQALYNHVSRLRRHLGAAAGRLERYGAGYVLRLEPDELDVEVARRLATELQAHARQPLDAVALARNALDLWRGPALEWARLAAEEIGAGLVSAEESAADRRLRAELDNLRAARDLARTAGDLDTCIDITLGFDEASIWRDLRELWSWCMELADDPAVLGHPREVEVVGSAAEGARIIGAFDRSLAYSRRGLAIAVPPEDAERLQARCWSSIAAVAHYRGDFEKASDSWTRSAVPGAALSAGHLMSAALAAGYAGHLKDARRLLEQGRAAEARHPCPTNRAFGAYVEGELTAVADPGGAIPHYLTAIELARSSGGNFVEGVASVALASARSRTGDVAAAAAGFADLLDYWHSTGHQTQLWTTARNAAQLLAGQGRTRAAALLLIRADATPGAAAVDQEIARHSGRVFLAPGDVVPPDEVDALRQDAGRLTTSAVIDLARGELASVCAGQGH